MSLVFDLVVLIHLIAWAALVGGAFVQLRVRDPYVNTAMLQGALWLLLSGVGLFVWLELGTEPVPLAKNITKIVIAVIIMILVAANRRFDSIPRGLLAIITGLALANGAIATLW